MGSVHSETNCHRLAAPLLDSMPGSFAFSPFSNRLVAACFLKIANETLRLELVRLYATQRCTQSEGLASDLQKVPIVARLRACSVLSFWSQVQPSICDAHSCWSCWRRLRFPETFF